MGPPRRSVASSTYRSRARAAATSCSRALTTSGCATRLWPSSRSRPTRPPEADGAADGGAWRATMCPYCGVGCGLLVQVRDGRVAKVKGDPAHPANFGDVCAKAVHLPPILRTADRLVHPQLRHRRGGALERVPWELALRFTADRVREIVMAHGPDAVAFYASGQLLTEEYYVAAKLARAVVGTNNFDTNSRLCMASAAAGYWRSLGSDGPPAAYADLDVANCFLLIGTNTADCHPITFKRIRKRKLQSPDAVTVIVVDPRWTETADLADLHLATGQIGRPGAGPFSLTGQPNAMGGRETGGLAHLLPGYRLVADAAARAVVERHWAIPAGRLPATPGRSALEIFEGLASGAVRAVWIMCTNPAASMPDLDLVEKALRQADLVVVQDAYHPTETTRFADVLLPAAQWPEKDGVMTNSERRLTYLPKLVEPPGEALPDTVILTRFAHEMGVKEPFQFASAAEVFDELAALTAGTVCDYSGLSHDRLRRDGPLQWPVPAPDHPGTERLYQDRRFPTPDGRARLVAVEHDEPLEPVDASFPLTLTTGRVRDHWHTLTRTIKSPALRSRTPEPILEVNLRDAQRAGIQDGDFVEITSRRGKAVAQCLVSAAIREGTCFLPFHWGRQSGFYKSANNLTLSARDPISQQPELKACAVRLRRVAEPPA